MEYYAEHKQTIHRVIHAVIMLYETEQNMYKHLDVQQYTWICVCRTCSCIDVFVDLCMSYLFLYRRLCGFVYVVLVLVSTYLWICVCRTCSCIEVFVDLCMSYLFLYRRICGFVYVELVLVSTSLWICVCRTCSCIDVFVDLCMSCLFLYRRLRLFAHVLLVRVSFWCSYNKCVLYQSVFIFNHLTVKSTCSFSSCSAISALFSEKYNS